MILVVIILAVLFVIALSAVFNLLIEVKARKIVQENEHEVRMMYDKLSGVLEEAYFLSLHNKFSKPKMVKNPMLTDVFDMVEPLQNYVHGGVVNLNLISQEFIKLNEENIKSMHKHKDATDKQEEALSLFSEKAESFDSIESLVMSDFFKDFPATKDFPASALFKELHHLAILYSDHLNRPNIQPIQNTGSKSLENVCG